VSTFWSVIVASAFLGIINISLFVWEVRVSRRRGRAIATRLWTASNLGCGVLRTLSVATIQGTLIAGYVWVADGVSWTWSISWWTWIAGFVAIDFAEYLSHRASHERPFMWAMHAVHHSSPEYNLSLNFRLGVLGPFTGFPFHLLLALAGMPTEMFVVLLPIQAFGMVFTHTRYPGTLGVFGLVLNAPAWHRVHHSAEQAHRDRNYGAVLIVWDRLLGTFTDGSEVVPRWGIDGEPPAQNPIEANVGPWRSLAARVRSDGLIALWRW
jgi:sterol desaturase/sphingolipid hydroxylase (fatty acid hydroxylase superfamily)